MTVLSPPDKENSQTPELLTRLLKVRFRQLIKPAGDEANRMESYRL
jgi:hypothetical protein